MLRRFARAHWVLGFALGAAAVAGACGGNNASDGSAFGGSSGNGGDGGGGSSGSDGGAGDASIGNDGSLFDTGPGPGDSGEASQGFDVQPAALQTITVAAGQTTPTVTFTATYNGHPINAGWSVDRGDLGTIDGQPTSSATFTPSGKKGGLVTIVAGLNQQTIERKVFIELTAQQNGPDATNPAEQAQIPSSVADLTSGGGVGGVGGEGLGTSVTDTATLGALGSPSGDGSAQELRFLYPYDKTVWPRGLLAPLLQWDWSIGDADAIQIELSTTSGSFSWTGQFARPAILQQTGGKFIRHPIPQDVWAMATDSAGGPTPNSTPDQVTVRLTVASGGQAYGPIEETWTVAPARLSGIIYYNSYGTQLAQNFGGAVGGNHMFGGAVLSIHVGDTGPKLVAGANGNESQCRVCHSVAANGSRLVVQHGENYGTSSAYDLSTNGSTENVLAIGATFPAMYPDGSMALSPNGLLLPLPNDATPTPVTGLAQVTTDLGTPSFSPDGKLVAFNPMVGPGVTNPTQKLLVMSFDPATSTFSNDVTVVDDTGQPAETRPGWPAFFPDGKSVVFQHQSAAGYDGNGSGTFSTRKGAKSQIAWTSVADAQHVTPLDQLNGVGYLPTLKTPISMSCTGDGKQVGNIDADHGDDANVNYEPTVNPVASGGYAWVVFTSRRMYGNVATIPPFCSDPRGVDLIQNITPKKLWVAAVDITGQPGADASHPAFYLPAQELLAGNSRGFWVLDPCKQDGDSCETGDQCCNGYCEPGGDGGALVCSNIPPSSSCSKPQEKCTTAADCCDATNLCINGFCAQKGPN